MRRIKIIHAADLHLDSPFQALSAAKAAVRREEQRELLAALAALASDESADLMLLSGDLLDSGNTYYETGEELIRGLAGVSCPVFIAPGSHDCWTERSPWARLDLPENIHVFRENAVHFISVPSADARVYGAAFTDRNAPALLRGFHAERKAGVYNLLCLHGEVGNPNSPCNPISSEDLAASGMDYAALGHAHSASGLQRSGNTWYAWPGCAEGHSFDECGEKTVNIVELDGEDARLRTACIASHRYEALELDISDRDPLLLIHTALPDDTVRDIYRITLTGETELAPDLRKLHRNLDEMFFALELRDKTRLRQDIWDGAGEDSLRGLFLRRLRARFDEARDEAERDRIVQAARWGLAALDNAEEVCVHDHS